MYYPGRVSTTILTGGLLAAYSHSRSITLRQRGHGAVGSSRESKKKDSAATAEFILNVYDSLIPNC